MRENKGKYAEKTKNLKQNLIHREMHTTTLSKKQAVSRVHQQRVTSQEIVLRRNILDGGWQHQKNSTTWIL